LDEPPLLCLERLLGGGALAVQRGAFLIRLVKGGACGVAAGFRVRELAPGGALEGRAPPRERPPAPAAPRLPHGTQRGRRGRQRFDRTGTFRALFITIGEGVLDAGERLLARRSGGGDGGGQAGGVLGGLGLGAHLRGDLPAARGQGIPLGAQRAVACGDFLQ